MAAASTSSDSVAMSGYSSEHFRKGAVPEHHAVALRVGLGDGRDALLPVPLARQFKSHSDHTFAPTPREYRTLDRDLFGLLVIEKSANLETCRVDQLGEFPELCPRMTCSTNSSPNRLVNGPERNKRR